MSVVKSASAMTVAMVTVVAMTMAFAQEPGGTDAKVKELQQQKLKLLEQRLEEAQALQRSTKAEPDVVLNDELDVLEYKLELATDKKERIEILNAMLKNRKSNEEYMRTLREDGRMTAKDDHLLPSVQLIDIEIKLALEQAKP